MALLDFLKSKNEIEKSKKPERKSAKVSNTKKEVKTAKPKVEKTEAEVVTEKITARINNGKFSYEAVKQPHISEKATTLSEQDQYTFEISPSYNKSEVKKAIEGIYGVNVLSVNIIKIPSKY